MNTYAPNHTPCISYHHTQRISCYLAILLVLGFPAIELSAQVTSTRFERIGREEGLSQGTVRAIVQDNRGFMWFATQDGLNLYDGYRFIHYRNDRDNPDSLVSNFVVSLAVDPAGFIWIGTSHGLDRFDPSSQVFKHFQANADGGGITGGTVSQLLLQDHILWVGTLPGGLTRIDTQTLAIQRFDPISHPELRSGVTALCLGEQDQIWIGTNRGALLTMDIGQKLEPFEKLPLEHPTTISSLMRDKTGGIWVATMGEGLYHIDRYTTTISSYQHDPYDENSIGDDSISAMLQTRDGSLWFGGSHQGLSKLFAPGGTFQSYRNQPYNLTSLSNDHIHALFQDRGGILWIGTSNGLCKLFPSSEDVRHYRHIPNNENSLSNNTVKAFWQDEDDILWVGTYGGGLDALDRKIGTFTHYHTDDDDPNSISSNNVFTIFQDDELRFWVGTYGGGLNLMDRQNGTFTAFKEGDASGLVSDYVVNLSPGPQGRFWVSTRLGTGLFDPSNNTFENVGNQQGGPGPVFVRMVYQTGANTYWIGTFASGLFRYDAISGGFHHFLHETGQAQSLANNTVQCMLLDSHGRFWIGTTAGLDLMDRSRGSFQHFSVQEGLASDVVYGILEDRAGRLWLSTNNGLTRFDPDENHFVNFGIRNGLQGLEFNSGAYLRTSRDEIVLGGTNGFNLFHPGNMITNPNPPAVVFTSFKIFNKEVELPRHISLTDRVELSYQDDVISLEFAALDFAAPEKNIYHYMLEGFDRDWQRANHRRFANYTNLDPGHYTFKVRATNDDGVWSEKPTTVELVIVPPFYRRTWFFVIIAICALAMLQAWVWNNRRQRNRLNRLIAERTASLEISNRQLKETAENLRDTQQQLLDTAHKVGMAEIASDVLHNVGNALNGMMVSTNVVDKHLENLKLHKLRRVSDLLLEHKANLPAFLAEEERGDKVVEIITRLCDDLENGREQARSEVRELHEHGLQIVSILRSQRKYALGEEFYEEVELPALIEDVLHIQQARIDELAIKVIRKFEKTRGIAAPKSKLLNVFNHIIKNSCEAMEVGSTREHRHLILSLSEVGNTKIRLSIKDSGIGIKREHLEWIFNQGFSTKEGGAGFGLHHCANAVMEVGGSIRAQSEGIGTGATFILDIPFEMKRKGTGEIV